jgi:hypothetical protein
MPEPTLSKEDSGGGGEERGSRGQITVSPMWKVSDFYLDITRVYVTDNPVERFDHLLRFPIWLSRNKEVGKKTAESPRSTAA